MERKTTSKFGDKRLDKRLAQITEALDTMPTAKLTQGLSGWANVKAGYRFLSNKKVTHQGIIETQAEATYQRMQSAPGAVILAVQDTTSFAFAGRPGLEGLGVLEDNRTPGFFAHTTLAVSEDGVPMGVLNQQVWVRPRNDNRDKEAHKKQPITAKESFKWLHGMRKLPASDRQMIVVSDRESDIYEFFQDAHNQEIDYVVRICRNRRLEDAPLIKTYLQSISPVSTYAITVVRQANQAARQATVELRYTTVTMLPPDRVKTARVMPLEPLTMQLVEVREIDAPATVERPIHWILATPLPVESIEDAQRIIQFYTHRWLVERFHYVLKTGGCNFEESQLRTVAALYRLLGICSRIAWRLLWLTYQSRRTPDAPCTTALDETEWQALSAFVNQSPAPAEDPPALRECVRWIAKLGGFLGRKSDGEPGVKTLWRGWLRLQDIVTAWLVFHPPPITYG